MSKLHRLHKGEARKHHCDGNRWVGRKMTENIDLG
jgi:hypothetical protein